MDGRISYTMEVAGALRDSIGNSYWWSSSSARSRRAAFAHLALPGPAAKSLPRMKASAAPSRLFSIIAPWSPRYLRGRAVTLGRAETGASGGYAIIAEIVCVM